jgi:beta-lactamase class A
VTAGAISQEQAERAIAEVAAASTGAIGLAARHLESGEVLSWQADEPYRTASTIKVGIHVSVMRRARLGVLDLQAPAELRAGEQIGGSGVLGVLRPGLRCTVSDLCTLMIVVSDNTATNMLIDLCGGAAAVSADLAELGFGGIRLNRPLSLPPAPLVAGPQPAAPRAAQPAAAQAGQQTAPQAAQPAAEPDGATPVPELAMVSPAEFGRLMAGLHAGTVIDQQASAEIISVLRHQQHQALFPRAFIDIAEPGDPPGPDGPAMAHKTGSIGGCRADTGLLYLPAGGGTVAYSAVADRLADRTMTALAEGEVLLGRLGAIVLARWWPGPGPVPLRDGWLPAPAAPAAQVR